MTPTAMTVPTAARQARSARPDIEPNAASRPAELVLANSPDGIVAVDSDLCVTLWNPGMERRTGLASADALGRHLVECIPSLAGDGDVRSFLDARDGRIFETVLSVSPEFDAAGRGVGAIAAYVDVAARNAIERDLRRREDQLRLAIETAAGSTGGSGTSRRATC